MPARRALVLAALPLTLALGACSSNDPADTGHADGFLVRAVNGECQLGQDEFRAGKVTFEVHNLGEKVSGFTVYAQGEPLEEEPELVAISGRNIKDVKVDLEPGTYELSCEPEHEDGPRTPITVTEHGPSEEPSGAPSEEAAAEPTTGAHSS